MNKRFTFIVIPIIIIISAFFLSKPLFSKDKSDDSSETIDLSNLVQSKPLHIPPLLEDLDPAPNQSEFHLTAQHGKSEVLDGIESDTLGYNGDMLGPIIKVRKGDHVKVKMDNELDEATTLHWHGLRIDGKYDGGPHGGIMAGETWEPEFTIEQPAATLWYHPHLMERTAKQVYEGLTGLLYIEDEITDQLDIPKDHGINDFPLIIQDKKMDESGNLKYNPSMTDMMRGLYGNAFLVNGAISPYLEVPKGIVRLRLVNGSNGRTYHFSLSNGQSFHQIASDGGLLEQSLEMSSLRLSPAERAEILVDFSQFSTDEKVTLINYDLGAESTFDDLDDDVERIELMEFIVTEEQSTVTEIPTKLTNIDKIDPNDSIKTREFVMAGVGERLTINDKVMDMDHIDEEVDFNTTEIWEVSNLRTGINGGMAHPFHVHGVQFQVLDRDGNPPPENESGWKDTVLIQPGEELRLIANFTHKGVFMYHCHILEHEDAGMMGQFEVK